MPTTRKRLWSQDKKHPQKMLYFSLRWYDPDQVPRVKSQSAVIADTPKVHTKVTKKS